LYGGTELQSITVISGDIWLTHPGSVGIVVAGEMKVLDDDGNECPAGVVGEIYMRPGHGAPPTYRYVGVTAKSRDGWDSLGDLGHFDADGFLYLSDRRVDMFTVGGRNVYPAEMRLAGYKVPRNVEFVDRPLRDDAGKARRSAVRDEVILRRRAQASR
jgi:bile acid-coenzyme A ligase